MKSEVAQYWLIAARAGFAKPTDWQGWADKRILSQTKPPIWVINMSLAKNVVELDKALAETLEGLRGLTPSAIDDVLIGYIWWRFEKGEIGLRECLRLSGKAADASCSTISCEQAFVLLNELELGKSHEKDTEMRAKDIFSPLKRLAEHQWLEIQSYA